MKCCNIISAGGKAPVNHDHLAGDIGRSLAGQKYGAAVKILQRAVAAYTGLGGISASQLRIVENRPGQGGGEEAGANGILAIRYDVYMLPKGLFGASVTGTAVAIEQLSQLNQALSQDLFGATVTGTAVKVERA